MSCVQDDTIALAYLTLAAAAAPVLTCKVKFNKYSDFGMFGVFGLHGVAGVMYYLGMHDLGPIFKITQSAATYFPVSSVNADLYSKDNDTASMVHLLSGFLPFMLQMQGCEDGGWGEVFNIFNISSISFANRCCNSDDCSVLDAWYLTLSSIFTYFMAPLLPKVQKKLFPQFEIPNLDRILPPLGMVAMGILGYKLVYNDARS